MGIIFKYDQPYGDFGTDGTLTKSGYAADAKVVGDRLTASNGVPFKFGVTEDGKYGYVITDGSGADTVIPFSNKAELYEALKYSGLVTIDMSYEEMLEVLAEYFPDDLNLNLLSVDDWEQVDTGATPTFTADPFYLKCGDASVPTRMQTKKTYNVGKFESLHIAGQAYSANTNVKFYVQFINADSGVADLSFSMGALSETPSFDKYIDVSTLSPTADYYIRVQTGQYNTTWTRFDTFKLKATPEEKFDFLTLPKEDWTMAWDSYVRNNGITGGSGANLKIYGEANLSYMAGGVATTNGYYDLSPYDTFVVEANCSYVDRFDFTIIDEAGEVVKSWTTSSCYPIIMSVDISDLTGSMYKIRLSVDFTSYKSGSATFTTIKATNKEV